MSDRAAGPSGPAACTPSELRRRIVHHLRRSGPATPADVATAIGASRSGVAQQLRALDAAGLVTRTAERHGVGRPRWRYDVTAEAQALFPARYDGLAADLLAAIVAVGGADLLEDVFQARRRQAGDRLRARLSPDAPLADRVRELAAAQDEAGYLSEVRVEDGAIRLLEHNCAVHLLARENPAPCQAELAMFRDLLGAEVERETHIASGDRCCTYRVTARA